MQIISLKDFFYLQDIAEVDLSTPLVENYETLNNDDVEIPVEFFDFLDVGEKCETNAQNSSSSPTVETYEKTENSVSTFVRKSVIQKHQRTETEKLESVTGTKESHSSTLIDTSIILKQKSIILNPRQSPKLSLFQSQNMTVMKGEASC